MIVLEKANYTKFTIVSSKYNATVRVVEKSLLAKAVLAYHRRYGLMKTQEKMTARCNNRSREAANNKCEAIGLTRLGIELTAPIHTAI